MLFFPRPTAKRTWLYLPHRTRITNDSRPSLTAFEETSRRMICILGPPPICCRSAKALTAKLGTCLLAQDFDCVATDTHRTRRSWLSTTNDIQTKRSSVT